MFFFHALFSHIGALRGPPGAPKAWGPHKPLAPCHQTCSLLNETIYNNKNIESSMGWIHDLCPIGNAWSFPLPPRAL